mgnify:CR=1 FL=1
MNVAELELPPGALIDTPPPPEIMDTLMPMFVCPASSITVAVMGMGLPAGSAVVDPPETEMVLGNFVHCPFLY